MGFLLRSICLICLLPRVFISAAEAPAQESPHDYGFALVLSGGGARGAAQIGVLRALEEAGLRPDLIVATSMGALIGSLYSAGYSPDSLEAIAKSTDWDRFYENTARREHLLVSQKVEPINYLLEVRFDSDLTPVLPSSISHGQAFYEVLVPRVAFPLFEAEGDFNDLPIPLRVVATDIISGKRVVFSQGNLAKAVRASCGVPLAFSPVRFEEMLLLDGGLSSNIPVEPAVELGAKLIVAVDVTSPMFGGDQLDNPVKLANQVLAIGIERQKAVERKLADVVIQPELSEFRNIEYSNLNEIIHRGYTAAIEAIPLIQERYHGITHGVSDTSESSEGYRLPVRWHTVAFSPLEKLDSLNVALTADYGDSVPKDTLHESILSMLRSEGYSFGSFDVRSSGPSGTVVAVDPGIVREIRIEGNQKTSAGVLLAAIELESGAPLTPALMDQAVSTLYATDLFQTVNAEVDKDMVVRIIVEEKPYLRARVGLRFDEFHLGEGYIQPAYENLLGAGIGALAHLQFGVLREKYAVELQSNQSFTPWWASGLRIQGYISRERVITLDTLYELRRESIDTTLSETIERYDEKSLRKAGVRFMIGTQLARVLMLDGGVRVERFKLRLSDESVFEDVDLGLFRKGITYLSVRLTVDNLDRWPFPLKGQKHYISVGGASDAIGGTESFLKSTGSLCSYFTLRGEHTFSTRFRYAWASRRLPEVERVYLGGALPEEKFRDIGVYEYVPFMGLPPRALSGDILLLAHAGYRRMIGKKFLTWVSLDWGHVWDQPILTPSGQLLREALKESPVGLGIGIGYQSVAGPIRFSWGRLLRVGDGLSDRFGIEDKNMLYFSAGYDF